ncbi:hypothetical protein ACFHYQ_21055 [Sphaerimonospora cavernae]|uniref:MFS transporter n=1 Tax=Sphaerimonospora cavernae TaxID=1740611 RepID=A0ABV6U9E0_9ACTN
MATTDPAVESEPRPTGVGAAEQPPFLGRHLSDLRGLSFALAVVVPLTAAAAHVQRISAQALRIDVP